MQANINTMAALIAGFVVSNPQIDEFNIRYVISRKMETLFPSVEAWDIDQAVTEAIAHIAIWQQYLGVIHEKGPLQ
jgi:hypothetical protein